MAITIDKATVQAKIRSTVSARLDNLLGEALQKRCFLSGEEAWTFRYSHLPAAAFPDETIYSGQVVVKAKKKYQGLVEKPIHHFTFSVRARGRFDMDVVLSVTGPEGF